MENQNRKSFSPLDHGKLPPQAVDLEYSILGGLLTHKDAILEVVDVITEKSFYKESSQKIYAAILELNTLGEEIDILSVINKLKKRGELDIVGGAYYVTQLTNEASSISSINYKARIIEQEKIARDIIRVSSDFISKAYDDTYDRLQLTDEFLSEAYKLGDIGKNSTGQSNNEVIKEITKEIENAKKLQGITGIRSGLLNQDLISGGYKNGDLYIKAGRPAMGKTGLVLCEANHISNVDNKKVLFFSLEMTHAQLMKRLIAIHSELSLNKMASGNMSPDDWKVYSSAVSDLMNENLTIHDEAAISLNKLIKTAKKHAIKKGLHIIYVDYLQLMRDPVQGNTNREQEISRISGGLKRLAKELKVPVVALAQLSRAVETRGGSKQPLLSDLRESGSIEQDADMVQFIYRPEYYGITEDEEGNPTNGRADIIFAKNRNGATSTIHLKFIPYLTKFKDYDDNIYQEESLNKITVKGDEFDTTHIPVDSKDSKEFNDTNDIPF